MVVLITSQYKEKDNIMTVAWHSPLSFNPPLFGIAIGKTRFSHNLIKKSKEFGVNFIDRKLEKAMLICGSISGRGKDKFKEAKLTRKKAKYISAPLIKEAVAWLECKVVKTIDVGDHTFFVGEVLGWEEKGKERIFQKFGRKFLTL
jgi:flavin reductase (DIM6/NTAB) family NADH-FMN oxidoreductase RutF